MKIKITALLLTLLMVFSLFGCSDKNGGSNDVTADPTASTSPLKSFNAKDIDGKNVDSNIFKGSKLTLVNIWATFCGPCISEMPSLGELSQEYKDKGVGFIGIVGDVIGYDGSTDSELVEKAKTIVTDTKASYTHIIPDSQLLSLLNSITGYPTTFLVDGDGNITGESIVGARSKQMWKTIIDEALAKVNS